MPGPTLQCGLAALATFQAIHIMIVLLRGIRERLDEARRIVLLLLRLEVAALNRPVIRSKVERIRRQRPAARMSRDPRLGLLPRVKHGAREAGRSLTTCTVEDPHPRLYWRR